MTNCPLKFHIADLIRSRFTWKSNLNCADPSNVSHYNFKPRWLLSLRLLLSCPFIHSSILPPLLKSHSPIRLPLWLVPCLFLSLCSFRIIHEDNKGHIHSQTTQIRETTRIAFPETYVNFGIALPGVVIVFPQQ